MNRAERAQSDLLDSHWTARRHDPAALAPAEIEPGLVATVDALEGRLRPPEPSSEFVAELRRRLERAAVDRPIKRAPRWPLSIPIHRLRPLAGLVAAALVFVILGAYILSQPPATVSADEVLRRAAATAALADGRTLVLAERATAYRQTAALPRSADLREGEELRSEIRRQYASPQRFRVEEVGAIHASNGVERPGTSWRALSVADGTDLWTFDSARNEVTVQRLDHHALPESLGDLAPFGSSLGSLRELLAEASTAYSPKVTGEETIAGRMAYVVDLGRPKRISAALPEFSGRRVLWIDKESFLVLKQVQFAADDGQALSTTETISVEVDVPVAAEATTFESPPGATLRDLRPKPAPSPEAHSAKLREIAASIGVRAFVPRAVPAGLVPRQPRLDPPDVLVAEYVPPAEVETDRPADASGLKIVIQPATTEVVDIWASGGEPLSVSIGQGWLRRGFRDADGTGVDSVALIARDGALISVSSFAMSAEELAAVAISLEPIAETPH